MQNTTESAEIIYILTILNSCTNQRSICSGVPAVKKSSGIFLQIKCWQAC